MAKGQQVFKSVCRSCHGGCTALLYVEEGRLVRVRPAPGSPFNLGQMCVKGLHAPEIMYHPSRLLKPLRRTGERGGGKWSEVTWDEALGDIASRLDRIRKESGPETIALGQGTGRHHFMHVVRFANSLGTPNWYEPGMANCLLPRITVSRLTYGGYPVADYYGDVSPKTILFWGHNPVVTGPDGELSFPVKKALRSGSYGIAVDPRRSETAARCGMWLPIRPGTDAALALAMIHVIIYEQLHDREFVDGWTVGFDRLKVHVAGMTPQWAANITSIPAEDIAAAARRYALDKPSVLEWGVAVEQSSNSLQTVRALAILRGLTGNIDIPGADILGMNIIRPYPTLHNHLPPESNKKRMGFDRFKLLAGFRSSMPTAHIPTLFSAMLTGEPYPIRALLIFGGNPMVTVADTHMVDRALKKLDFLVVTDLFMTPTAARADYVLPAAFWPEVNQIVELPYVAENAVLVQKRIAKVGECRQDEEIMIDLAQRLDLPGSEESLEDILDHRMESLGTTFRELEGGSMIFPPHQYRKFEKNGFRTPSGKVELYCKALERLGYDPLPSYMEPAESPVASPELAKDFPYVLTTGSRRREFFHSEHRQIKSLRSRRPDPVAEIAPDIAQKHAISDGQWIRVSTPRGKIAMKARVNHEIRAGVVNIEHGWWFPEKEGPEYGVWRSNANVLTSSDPPFDPAFGSYQLRGLLCAVEKLEDSDEP